MPEIDIPGHTLSWFKSHPELQGMAKEAIDPTNEKSYEFIERLLKSVSHLFETRVIHLGGDEFLSAWDTPGIQSWMEANNIPTKADLIIYWLNRVNRIAKKLELKVWMWEDYLSVVPKDMLDQHKEDWSQIRWQMWQKNLHDSEFFGRDYGRPVIFSTDFYLDHLQLDWSALYSVPMRSVNGGGVMGAEACMWGEWVDDSNFISRVWPRAAAVAEALWTAPSEAVASHATMRLAKWRCREKEIFGHDRIEPVGQVSVDNPSKQWIWHTDKSQWYCDETDLVRGSSEVPIFPHKT
jgi:hexosaminidase